MKSFTSINNALMAGQQPPNYKGDIRNFLSGGVFDNFHGIDKNALLDRMNVFLIGYGVNALWRQMKVFILGGAACDQDQGIGEGPKAYSVCRDGKQWFLYYWHEGNRDPFSRKQWGYVALVPGSDKLNKEDYSGVTVEVSAPLLTPLELSLLIRFQYNRMSSTLRLTATTLLNTITTLIQQLSAPNLLWQTAGGTQCSKVCHLYTDAYCLDCPH